MTRDFNQAQALVKRLMEGMGGSADAYAPDSPEPQAGNVAPDPIETALPEPTEDCLEGALDWQALEGQLWTNPDPIDADRYEAYGVIEDSEELKAIYEAFRRCLRSGQPESVKLETGTYQLRKPTPKTGWELVDTVKDRLYMQQVDVHILGATAEDAEVFIWVAPASNPDQDLGYIHEGYVFLHK